MTKIDGAASHEPRYEVLGPADLAAVYRLHRSATGAVGRPDLVKPESRAFFERLLAGEGRIIGAWIDDVLAGYGVLQLQLPPSEDARPYFGLGDTDILIKLAGASVLPGFWGRGIHDALIDGRVRAAEALGFRHLYATSAPGNSRSWENLLDAGFAVRGLIEKYGGHIRYLLYRDLHAADAGERDGVWCAALDLDRQRDLVSSGHAGAAWRPSQGGGREIFYRKLST